MTTNASSRVAARFVNAGVDAKIWLVTDPTGYSEVGDFVMNGYALSIGHVILGMGSQFGRSRPAFHTNERDAMTDAMKRLKKKHGGNVPKELLTKPSSV